MDFQKILTEIKTEIEPLKKDGKIASYIPELAKVDPEKYGVHISTVGGNQFSIGDSNEKFSIQSITKVFSTSLAFSMLGESIWKRVGVEPAGTSFNSLIRLEFENGIPQNPFINAGALVIADMLISCLKNPKQDYLEFIRKISGVPDINYNFQVAGSEKEYGYRNAALVNFMKSYKNIHNDVNEVLDFYFHLFY